MTEHPWITAEEHAEYMLRHLGPEEAFARAERTLALWKDSLQDPIPRLGPPPASQVPIWTDVVELLRPHLEAHNATQTTT